VTGLVLPALAAIYDDRNPPTEADLATLSRTVTAEQAHTFRDGPFAVAWTGHTAAHFSDGEGFVVVHGHLWATGPTPQRFGGDIARDPTRFLEQARGDFAMVAYDRRARRLTVARDQLGGRLIVWHEQHARVSLASDTKLLLRLLPSRPGPDAASLAHWLSLSGTPVGRTLFDGVHQLAPAHRLDMERQPPRVTRYWAPTYVRPARTSSAEAAAGLRTVLSEAVRRRSDGAATGVLLSGGLDSSTVAALATELPDGVRPRRAYSAVFPDHPTIDEEALINRLSAAFDLEITRVVVRSGSVLSGALAYVREWELPPISPNLFFWLPLLRGASADGVDALLDGEGGDELFGLSPYLLADYLRHGRIRGALRLLNRIPGTTERTPRRAKRPILVRYGIKGVAPAALHEAARRHRGGPTYTAEWLRPAIADLFLESHEASGWKRLAGPRWWTYLVDLFTRGLAITMMLDHVRHRGAMCGVEPRHPILDVDVIEHVLRLPPELAWDPRWSRPIMREALAGRLPDEVRLRVTKSTFDAIFHASLAGPDLPLARELLDPDRAAVSEYVDGEALRRLVAAPPEPTARLQWAMEVWRLSTAELWLEHQAGTLEATFERLRVPPADIELTRPAPRTL
jgi:asparagine synthase (glutamine-hydrolysing)